MLRCIYNIYVGRTKKYVYTLRFIAPLVMYVGSNKIVTSMEILWIRSDNVGGRRMANGKHKNLFAGPARILSL